MEIAVLKINEKIEEQLFAELLRKVDPAKQDRIKGFLFWHDRQRSLFADLLLRTMLIRSSGLRNQDIRFAELPNGKPVLLNDPAVHFNISHSGDWMACIVDDGAVGIDVEKVSDTDLSLSDRFFSRCEHEEIRKAENPVQKFFEYWTLKESYIKFTGTGLSQPLNSFSLKFLANAEVRVEANAGLLAGVYFRQYEIEDGYKAAACAGHGGFPGECVRYRVEEVMGGM